MNVIFEFSFGRFDFFHSEKSYLYGGIFPNLVLTGLVIIQHSLNISLEVAVHIQRAQVMVLAPESS